MKPFSLLLLLMVSGILCEILFRPLERLAVLCQRLQRRPAHSKGMRQSPLPATGLAGSLRRSPADNAWHPAAQF